uniref:Uncharacterized protein n=1 Tax=Pelusios castaneus TaxID=367368 RepID=A0A8C8R6A6_9SAUR
QAADPPTRGGECRQGPPESEGGDPMLPDQWATLLAPYLTGAPQTVKAAILDCLDISPETFCQRFRGKIYVPGTRPRAITQELKEVINQIVLEQFLHILPTAGRGGTLDAPNRGRPHRSPARLLPRPAGGPNPQSSL